VASLPPPASEGLRRGWLAWEQLERPEQLVTLSLQALLLTLAGRGGTATFTVTLTALSVAFLRPFPGLGEVTPAGTNLAVLGMISTTVRSNARNRDCVHNTAIWMEYTLACGGMDAPRFLAACQHISSIACPTPFFFL